MLRSIRNVKLLKCVSLICLSPLFVFYSSLSGYYFERAADLNREKLGKIKNLPNLANLAHIGHPKKTLFNLKRVLKKR